MKTTENTSRVEFSVFTTLAFLVSGYIGLVFWYNAIIRSLFLIECNVILLGVSLGLFFAALKKHSWIIWVVPTILQIYIWSKK